MKHYFFLLACLLAGYTMLQAQHKSVTGTNDSDEFFINFENNDYGVLEFDDKGIWQVGKPNKGNWTEALNGDNVLITDTTKMLNQPVKTWVTFKYERPWWSNCIRSWGIAAKYIYDLSFQKAGFYIEVSYDLGHTWYQFAEDTFLNNDPDYILEFQDTLINGNLALTGTRDDWPGVNDYFLCQKQFYPDTIAAKVHNVWLRFVYENIDTITHQGFLMDSLAIRIGHYCEFLSIEEFNELDSKLYPNPLVDHSTLEFNNPLQKKILIEITDITGKVCLKQFVCTKSLSLNKSDFFNGYYVYRVIDGNKIVQKGKFIVQ